MKNKILHGDALTIIKTLPAESVDMILTSPPYWALRDYGVVGQLGLEVTFEKYIEALCAIFDEAKRVLKKTGTCWVNMGDTYGGTGDKGNWKDPKYECGRNGQSVAINKGETSKSLVQIPSRFAIEMCARGWILRNEIIWHKPNAMPSSVKDRFSVDYEKLFFFTQNKKYFFEQQREPYTKPLNRWAGNKLDAKNESEWDQGTGQKIYRTRDMRPNPAGRNMRSVWKIPTVPFKAAHFATYPEKLCEIPISSGCPIGGIVLDPFFGAGTTGLVANKLGRNYLGIELNPEYIKIAENRLAHRQKTFAEISTV